MIRRFRWSLMIAVVGSLSWLPSSNLYAQGSSLFSGSGVTRGGTGGISGSMTGSGLGRSTSGGGGSTSGLGSSTSGMGSRTSGGGGGMGRGNSGGSGTFGTGMTAGQSSFGNTGNQGFVGRNSGLFAGNSQTGQGNTGRGQTRNFNSNSGRQQNFSQRSQSGASERTTSSIRPRQKVAFDFNAKSPTIVATRAGERMTKIGTSRKELKGIDIRVDGDTLILTGNVNTEEQSRLAANILRLEPGVRSIRNELVVMESPSTTPTEVE